MTHSTQKKMSESRAEGSPVISSPFLACCCFLGQQTNSTPEKTSMPHGRSIAKDLTRIPRWPQAAAAVRFHWSKSQQRDWLCTWSKRQCSGTSRASLWNGPAAEGDEG